MAARLPSSSIKPFLLRWAESGGPFAPVRSVWLELDLDRMLVEEAPSPVVCAKLSQGADPGWVTETLLPALQGGPLTAGQRARILSCLDALPPSASLLYVFSLRARGSDAVRLELFGLEPAEMLSYLEGVTPEMVPAVAKAALLFEGVERLHLSFDVTDAILPRIGIEGSFPRQPSREPRWQAFFERLVESGLCSPGKREAVLAWPGYDTFWTAPERWPVSALGPQGACLRTLSHVKVVCRPDRDLEAKAYLTFGPPERSSEGATASSRGEPLGLLHIAGEPQLREGPAGLAELPRRLVGTRPADERQLEPGTPHLEGSLDGLKALQRRFEPPRRPLRIAGRPGDASQRPLRHAAPIPEPDRLGDVERLASEILGFVEPSRRAGRPRPGRRRTSRGAAASRPGAAAPWNPPAPRWPRGDPPFPGRRSPGIPGPRRC